MHLKSSYIHYFEIPSSTKFYAPRTVHSGFFLPNVNVFFLWGGHHIDSWSLVSHWNDWTYNIFRPIKPFGETSSDPTFLGWRPKTLIVLILKNLGVSKNMGTPKWMVYNGKPYQNGWFGGTPIFGNIHLGGQPTHGITEIRPFSGLFSSWKVGKGTIMSCSLSIQPHFFKKQSHQAKGLKLTTPPGFLKLSPFPQIGGRLPSWLSRFFSQRCFQKKTPLNFSPWFSRPCWNQFQAIVSSIEVACHHPVESSFGDIDSMNRWLNK